MLSFKAGHGTILPARLTDWKLKWIKFLQQIKKKSASKKNYRKKLFQKVVKKMIFVMLKKYISHILKIFKTVILFKSRFKT